MTEDRSAQVAQARQAADLWIEELAASLEVEGIRLDADALLRLADLSHKTVSVPAAPLTTFLVGYVTGLAEATGQADYEKASRAAVRVANQLLERRRQAVG